MYHAVLLMNKNIVVFKYNASYIIKNNVHVKRTYSKLHLNTLLVSGLQK